MLRAGKSKTQRKSWCWWSGGRNSSSVEGPQSSFLRTATALVAFLGRILWLVGALPCAQLGLELGGPLVSQHDSILFLLRCLRWHRWGLRWQILALSLALTSQPVLINTCLWLVVCSQLLTQWLQRLGFSQLKVFPIHSLRLWGRWKVLIPWPSSSCWNSRAV